MPDFPTQPSAHAAPEERADYFELAALRDVFLGASEQGFIENAQRDGEDEAEDAEAFGGVENDRTVEIAADEAADELAARNSDFGPADDFYPYVLDQDALSLKPDWKRHPKYYLYWFCLLASRLNMRDERVHGGLDGTQLFEEICLHVAVRYFGGPDESRVGSMLFGTARHTLEWDAEAGCERTAFADNVEALCLALREGSGFKPKREGSRVKPKDAKVDVVVWRKFFDRYPGKLIAFGQCKTGHNWHQGLTQLQPTSFEKKFVRDSFAVTPIKLFFTASRVSSGHYDHSADGGVFFDRCRVIQFADTIPEELLQRCQRWVKAAGIAKGLRAFAAL